jgi:hypothetical protein
MMPMPSPAALTESVMLAPGYRARITLLVAMGT